MKDGDKMDIDRPLFSLEGENIEQPTYQEAKDFIRSSLVNMAQNFIAIGYALKYVRDRRLYENGGYASVWEFAQVEYGFSKSTASRYMSMNDRFSEGGNSPEIQEQYQGFNKSQLQEMLSLDEEQLGKVTPADRVEDIRTMKKPREIPYVDLPGQISIAELTGIDPEEPAAAGDGLSGPEEEEAAAQPQPYTLTVDQLIGEDGKEAEVESIAIPQQEPVEASGWCLHRPQFQCTLPEEAKRIPGDGLGCTGKCCWDCPKHGKCRIECYASAQRPEDGGPESVARSQQEGRCGNGGGCLENAAELAAEALSAYGTPKRIYPPDSLIAEDGCKGGHYCFLCAMDCQIRGKERHCREAPPGNPFSCEIVKGGFAELPETCQFVDHDLAEHSAGSGEADPCCKNCPDPCEYICGRAMKALDQAAVILEADQESTQDEKDLDESYNLGDLPQVRDKYLDELAQMMVNYMGTRMVTFGGRLHMQDNVIEEKLRIFADKSGGVIQMSEGVITYPCGELIEFIRGEEDLGISSFRRFANHVRKIMENWTPQIPETADEPDDTDLALICKMLDKEKKDLDEMEKVLREEPDPTLGKITRKKRLMVKAIEGLLGEMDQPEKAEPEQQDLPALKNNDQRKEWLGTFHDWPVWFEVPEAAEVYYRYDLPDGCSLVICEYHYWARWKVEFKYGGDPECTGTREYLLTPGYHYLEDCKSNRTSMIEKLKEIQKAGGKNEEK